MRRKHLCLREETYHKAGALAVDGHIFAYRIATTWTHKSMNSQPELLLPGSSRMLSKPKIYLGEALITKCCGFSDYGFVMNKLNSLVT